VTAVIIVVLVLIGIGAVVSVPLMIKSTRRQVAEEQSTPGRRPALGSPAQVWVSRGERVLRELSGTLGPNGASVDATEVVAELRITASQVAELDHAIAQIPVPSLEEEQRALAVSLAASLAESGPAAADLARSHDAVTARLASAARQREARDALLARMQATVTEFERARDELAELIAGTANPVVSSADSAGELAGRLDALRAGLVEVRRASNPETGRGGQGIP